MIDGGAVLQSITFVFIIIVITILSGFFGVVLWFIMDWSLWNVKCTLLWPVGNPYYIETTENGITKNKKVISVEAEEKPGRLYNKKIKQGTFKQYFKIKSTNFDRQNYFDPHYFTRRIKRGMLDIKATGISLFMHPKKGPIPLSLQNPTMEVGNIEMNTVISAYVNTQKDIKEKYDNDFWAKYGSVIAMALVITLVVICFVFMIKLQEISWANANEQLQATLSTVQGMARPPIK